MKAEDVFARINADHPEIAEIAHEVDPPFILAGNVIRTCTLRGLTPEQLAERTGLTLRQIRRIQCGDSNPRLLTIAKIAHVLGLTLPELLGEQP
ncbi:MAG TPA: helix-turn-helix transcriptional regulator [Longimicrobium sp.]